MGLIARSSFTLLLSESTQLPVFLPNLFFWVMIELFFFLQVLEVEKGWNTSNNEWFGPIEEFYKMLLVSL